MELFLSTIVFFVVCGFAGKAFAALPGGTDVHVDTALSAVSIGYRNQAYIWPDLFPVVPTAKQSDKYHIFDKADLLRNEAGVRAPGTLANRGGYRLSTGSFFCNDHSFGKQTPDEISANADESLELDQADTEYVTGQVELDLELELAGAIFTTGVWGTDATPSTQWGTLATSDPLADAATGIETVLKNTGYKPNTLTLGYEVWTVLMNHPDFIDRLATQTTRVLQEAAAAQLFGVENLIVGTATQNTASEGETFVGSFVWGKHALLTYVPPSPGKRTPSAGYTFRWGARKVLRYRDTPEGVLSDVIEVHDYLDPVVTGSDLGYMMDDAIA